MIETTHGLQDEANLMRTTCCDDHPLSFAFRVEWRLLNHDGIGCEVCAAQTNPKLVPMFGMTLVREDAFCVPKRMGVAAETIAAAIG